MKHESAKPKVLPAAHGSALLQRKCACGGPARSRGECGDCKKKKLQRRESQRTTPAAAPPIVHEVLQSPGQPLDSATRQYFEPRFGHDFGRVRVHADNRAAESARAVNAKAYTVGSNVVFASGQYAPGANGRRELMAHELAHTVQQSDATVLSRLGDRRAHEYSEVEADRAAHACLTGWPQLSPGSSPAKVSRQQAHPESKEEQEKKKEQDEEINVCSTLAQLVLQRTAPSSARKKRQKEAELEAQNKRKKEIKRKRTKHSIRTRQPGHPGNLGLGFARDE